MGLKDKKKIPQNNIIKNRLRIVNFKNDLLPQALLHVAEFLISTEEYYIFFSVNI
jgi:hypothetical protein